jgi:hypothetical protein
VLVPVVPELLPELVPVPPLVLVALGVVLGASAPVPVAAVPAAEVLTLVVPALPAPVLPLMPLEPDVPPVLPLMPLEPEVLPPLVPLEPEVPPVLPDEPPLLLEPLPPAPLELLEPLVPMLPLPEVPPDDEPLALEPLLPLWCLLCFFLLECLLDEPPVEDASDCDEAPVPPPVDDVLLDCAWAFIAPDIASTTEALNRPFSNLLVFMSLS